jgi:sugar phosphate isomerase/epimerase
MIFGMSTACFFPHTYTEQTIEQMARMNVRHIEVFFCCLSEYKKSFVDDLKRRIDDAGISVYSIHALSLQFEPQLFSPHARARQDSLDIYRQVLEAGAALGAGVYVFHGPSNVKKARKFSVNYPYTAEYADPLADMAKDYGIRLAWENVHWCWYAEPDFPAKLLPHMTSDNLYFTLDAKQAAQAGHDPSDYIDATQGRLVNVHICDFERSPEKGVVPRLPFEGEMDFGRFTRRLAETGYDGGVMLEVYSHNYRDLPQLQSCYERMTRCFSQPV